MLRPLLAVLAGAMLVTSCTPVNRQGPASGATTVPPPTVPVTAALDVVDPDGPAGHLARWPEG